MRTKELDIFYYELEVTHMRLKELRIIHGLTQKQVAEIIGVNVKTYRKYESGNYARMKATKIVILMRYYGVTCDYLLGVSEV